MKKPTLLYVSPFWPMKSGISEYSEKLIYGLQPYFDVTLLVNNYKIENRKIIKQFKCLQYDVNADYSRYDEILYNFGNNPEYHGYMYEMALKYQGYIILHDFVLYYLTTGYYTEQKKLLQKIYELEGIEGIQTVKDSLKKNPNDDLIHHKEIAAQLPMNKEVLELAKGIFVHSEYTKDLVRKVAPQKEVYKIHLVQSLFEEDMKKDVLRKLFSIEPEAFIVGSVGYIAETKQNRLACLAINQYNACHDKKIHYVMIGEGDYVDDLLGKYIHKTGFIENKDFYSAIADCDLILNLRYPYHGESSATLLQCMAMGKICVVTDIGWFSELPDDTVVKESVELTVEKLNEIIELAINGQLDAKKKVAIEYVANECDAKNIGEKIYRTMS